MFEGTIGNCPSSSSARDPEAERMEAPDPCGEQQRWAGRDGGHRGRQGLCRAQTRATLRTPEADKRFNHRAVGGALRRSLRWSLSASAAGTPGPLQRASREGVNSSPRRAAGKEHGLLKPSQGVLSTWGAELQCDLSSFPTHERAGVGTKALTDTVLQHAWTVSLSGVLTGSLSG